eukprot:1241691-Pleurochrysis_carterae.AAC.1
MTKGRGFLSGYNYDLDFVLRVVIVVLVVVGTVFEVVDAGGRVLAQSSPFAACRRGGGTRGSRRACQRLDGPGGCARRT